MKRKTTVWTVVVIVAAIGLAFGLYFGLRPNEQETLTISTNTYPAGGIIYVAEERGYFEDEGFNVDIKIIDDWRARSAAYQGGEIDIMLSTVDAFAFESAELRPGKILMTPSYSDGADGVVATAEIQSVTDLAGKRVAFAEATPSHYYLAHVLETAGMSMDDIVQVTVDDASLAGQAFLSGQVDAAVTWEPFVSMASELPGGHIIATTLGEEPVLIDVFVASDIAFETKRDAVNGFVRACLKAIDDVIAEPASTYTTIANGLSLPLEDTEAMISVLAIQDADGNREMFGVGSSGASMVEERFDTASQVWVDGGIVEQPVSSPSVLAEDLYRDLFR